jgi:hypothetical protein
LTDKDARIPMVMDIPTPVSTGQQQTVLTFSSMNQRNGQTKMEMDTVTISAERTLILA